MKNKLNKLKYFKEELSNPFYNHWDNNIVIPKPKQRWASNKEQSDGGSLLIYIEDVNQDHVTYVVPGHKPKIMSMDRLQSMFHLSENLNLEDKDDSDATQDLSVGNSSSQDPEYKPEPYVEDPNRISTTDGRSIKLAYNPEKQTLAIQVQGSIESIKLYRHDIEKLMKMLQKIRGGK